ncbi:unnamed protein product [Linum tenue]|uniref:Uncharacterized protein n=1 Tax=Linum tenue TaxID=586396 RepID=A0AAV0MLS4_9ROSI|nr:unnamed protein product [Linum tenue]
MMGRGRDGGCGSGERHCRPNCRVTATNSVAAAAEPEVPATMEKKAVQSLDVDFFSQASKALCERSPFDVPEEVPGSVSSTSTTLPSGLASLLRHSESRKRNKKSHHGGGKKSSRAGERSKGGNIWVESEDYFRDLVLADVEALVELCSPLRSLAARSCFSLPNIGNGEKERSESQFNQDNPDNDMNACVENRTGMVSESEAQQEAQQHMEIDRAAVQTDGGEFLPSADSGSSGSPSYYSGSLGWVLGCRNRNLLTTERPSKKRKLLGVDVGLDKLLVGSPCQGNSSICDFCCKGDFLNDLNKLIVCSSCHIAVHSKCYGVQGDEGDPWLCTRCKLNIDKEMGKQPCVLCPKQGGASKPVADKNGSSEAEFVHLFCSIWMPEVYVEDLTKMEPIMNVSGIKETHKKLVCNVCKVKHGACVRCSHGACRLAFHPICAREARHRIEVWGKYGHDSVELRVFCSKHSGLLDGKEKFQAAEASLTAKSVSVADCSLVMQSPDKHREIIENGGKFEPCIGSAGLTYSVKSGDVDQDDLESSVWEKNVKLVSDGDAFQRSDMAMSERSDIEVPSSSGSLNLAVVMKKLIQRGKINVKDVAAELGVSPDSLTAILAEDILVPEVQCKIVKWLSSHACMGASLKNSKVKLKSAMVPMSEETSDFSDVVAEQSDMAGTVAIKSVPPRRRTKNTIKFRKNDETSSLSKDTLAENGMGSELRVEQLATEDPEDANKASTSSRLLNDGAIDLQAPDSPKNEGSMSDLSECSSFKKVESTEADASRTAQKLKGTVLESDVDALLLDLIKMDASSGACIHPSILELIKMHKRMPFNSGTSECEGVKELEISGLESSSNANACCNHKSTNSEWNAIVCDNNGDSSGQLLKAAELGVFPLSPADEVEGEIIYFQHKLLSSAVQRKHMTGTLVKNLSKSLPKEIDASRKQIWDSVLVNQYICELREAKKQGRKEKRNKEAQAYLAAATAAAAASSRTSFLRKVAFDECTVNEKLNVSNGTPGLSSQSITRPKGKLSRVTLPRISSDKYSDFVQSVPEVSKEHPRSCDICRRPETIMNPILVCSSCKVAVHLDCYCNVKESPGPWHCELCEDLLSARQSGGHSLNFWEKPYFVAECGLCGGATGAFRKCINGQWVHAFCAEWLLQSVYRRGQVNPVEGMEDLLKGTDLCCVCRHKHGACLRCSYGHCQTTFHPSCAKSAGFFMNVKFLSGKFQYRAYCEQHSLEQKLKAESQKHGVDELKCVKQIRVELERLRLLCERIIKREKLKRDLVICSHSILASKRDHAAHSALVQNPFFHPDASSESATTSLKGNVTDGYSDAAIQRSNEITADSAASTVKKRLKVTMSTDTEQRTDDNCLTYQPPLNNSRPTQRQQFAGKQIPKRACPPACNLVEEADSTSRSRKRVETLQKELVMTSDQASMRNQQLPKGYFYIPVDCLPKENQTTNDQESSCPGEPLPPGES